MADTTPGGNVALGRANTGSAFVLDQNIADRPRAIIQDAEQMRYARAKAEEKARADQEAKVKDEFNKFLNVNGQASLLYKENDLKETENFINQQAQLQREYDAGRIDRNELLRRGQQNQFKMQSYRDTTNKLEESRLKVAEALKDKRYNAGVIQDKLYSKYIDPATGKIYTDPNKVPKFEESIKPELENADNLNQDEVAKAFIDNLTTLSNSDEDVVNSRFMKTTETSTKLPFQRDANGKIIKNPYSGRPKLVVDQSLADLADKDPFVKLIIDKKIGEQEKMLSEAEASGDPAKMKEVLSKVQTRAQIAANFLEERNPFSYKETIQERSYPPRDPEKKEDKNALKLSTAVVSYNKEYLGSDAKTPYYQNHVIAGVQTNGKNNVVQVAPKKVYFLDGDNRGKVTENASIINLSVGSIGYGLAVANDKEVDTEKTIKNADGTSKKVRVKGKTQFADYTERPFRNEQELLQFIRNNPEKMGKEYKLNLYAIGQVVDDKKIENDAATETNATNTGGYTPGGSSPVSKKKNTVKIKIDDPNDSEVLNNLNSKTDNELSKLLFDPNGKAQILNQAYQQAIQSQRNTPAPNKQAITPKKAETLRSKYGY